MRDTIHYQLRNEDHKIVVTYESLFDFYFKFYIDGNLAYKTMPWHNLPFEVEFAFRDDQFKFSIGRGYFKIYRDIDVCINGKKLQLTERQQSL